MQIPRGSFVIHSRFAGDVMRGLAGAIPPPSSCDAESKFHCCGLQGMRLVKHALLQMLRYRVSLTKYGGPCDVFIYFYKLRKYIFSEPVTTETAWYAPYFSL